MVSMVTAETQSWFSFFQNSLRVLDVEFVIKMNRKTEQNYLAALYFIPDVLRQKTHSACQVWVCVTSRTSAGSEDTHSHRRFPHSVERCGKVMS